MCVKNYLFLLPYVVMKVKIVLCSMAKFAVLAPSPILVTYYHVGTVPAQHTEYWYIPHSAYWCRTSMVHLIPHDTVWQTLLYGIYGFKDGFTNY